MKRWWPVVILTMCALIAPRAVGAIIYVDASAVGGLNNGSSWQDAYLDLDDALAVDASGDEIRIGPGVYTTLNNFGYSVSPGVNLRGGYAGASSLNPDDWDPSRYVTRLSGDRQGDDGPNFTNRGDNCVTVVTLFGHEPVSISGLTVAGARSQAISPSSVVSFVDLVIEDNYSVSTGSAVSGGTSLVFYRCVVRGNKDELGSAVSTSTGAGTTANFFDCLVESNFGGGIATGNAFVSNCTIRNNARSGLSGFNVSCHDSVFESNGLRGLTTTGNATVTNCTFSSNAGGGLRCDDTATLLNCTFDSNSASTNGGGASVLRGTITDCIFSNNVSSSTVIYGAGGGLCVGSNAVTITNCNFEGNFALYARGGGAYLGNGSATEGSMTNCRFEDNYAAFSAGFLLGANNFRVENCIVRGNQAFYHGGGVGVGAVNTLIRDCLIENNSAGQVGGIQLGGSTDNEQPLIVQNCRIVRNHAQQETGGASVGPGARLEQCLIIGNTAGGWFGGVRAGSNESAFPAVVDGCVIAYNHAGGLYGGVGAQEAFLPTVKNCIIWANSDSSGNPSLESVQPVVAPMRCCIQNLSSSLGGFANVSGDPLFVDPAGPDGDIGTLDDDFQITKGSSCINTGELYPDTTAVADFAGNARVQQCQMDIGPFETPYLGVTDCNLNGLFDGCEILDGLVQDANLDGVPDVCQPTNDTCLEATIATIGVAMPFATYGAQTDGPDEPGACTIGGSTQIDNDVWFRVLSPCSQTLRVSACDVNYNAKLAVYIGCPTAPGSLVACGDNECGQGPVATFAAPGPTLYRIRVGGVNGARGTGSILIECVATPCAGDVDGSGTVNVDDLLGVVNAWGACAGCPADITGNGIVDIDDLLMVINGWGACP